VGTAHHKKGVTFMRKPLGYMPPNPKISNIFLDSCAFDPKYSPEDQASIKINQLDEIEELMGLKITHSNQREIDHPNTPDWVKRKAEKLIYSNKTGLTNNEIQQKAQILKILTGNGKPEKMANDAEHVFEVSKYCGYFITTDKRILNKKDELEKICSAIIVKPSEFLKIWEMYENTYLSL
jgi:hypothetical protein